MDDHHVYDTNFTEEINNKMQVPKSIRVNGDVSNFRSTNYYSDDNSRFGDNFDMRVPEKIILIGNNQHQGSSSKPREFAIDDLIIPQPPAEEFIRVQTPPQKITMSRHYFPSVLDDFEQKSTSVEQNEESIPNNTEPVINAVQINPNMSFFNASISEPMTISEELAHLRQQMGRVSRRVIELEHTASLPFYVREKKLIVTLVCSYVVFKFASWLTRR
ncbi:transport and golgi organization [Acyrthosiphon pisum]|uniref:Mff-like domain-containing protein n=1 Tax=Acyrthosiphon pisum TaxID=7029 RepID=A0A8R1XIE9_ACYPI|nr:transport and golgi organization [Acyrthosiphon pisum]|eukprot:NP_001155953.1 transport and golgi organization [Acyrthosiphon pisum]